MTRLLIAGLVLTCLIVAGFATAGSPAVAGTTAISTFSKLGVDPSTGSTAASGGPAGNTLPGDTINWVLGYKNTTGGLAAVNITDPITGNQTFVPGSLQVPPGFTRQWSTNGGTTYVTTQPASGVNAVGATGTSVSGSTGAQVVSVASPSSINATNAGGDGWEALFFGPNVYNIHHHRTPGPFVTVIDCHVKSTGAQCAGYPANVSATAGVPLGPLTAPGADTLYTAWNTHGVVDQLHGKIYFPAGREVPVSHDIGVSCVDVVNNLSCGFTSLDISAFANLGQAVIAGGAIIGSRYYLLGTQAQIYCFDYMAALPCGAPFPLSGLIVDPTYINATSGAVVCCSNLQSFDNRYVFGNILRPALADRDLLCLDTTTNTVCPGFPVTHYVTTNFASNVPIAPILSSGGNVIGICGEASTSALPAAFACFNLAGVSVPTPWTQQVPNATVNWAGYGNVLRVGTKLYFAETVSGAATYTCWDFATGAPCTGFLKGTSGANIRAYTLRQDPFAPDCVWEVGDAGLFEVFSATLGTSMPGNAPFTGASCNGFQAQVSVTPAAYYCDGNAGHVAAWSQLLVGGVTPSNYASVTVTITDSSGNPVPGWNGQVFPSAQPTISISAIPASGSTATLNIAVVFNGVTAGTPTMTATFTGDPVQVCFKTVVGSIACGAAPISIADTATAVTTAGAVSDGPLGNGSGIASFNETADPKTCPNATPTASPTPTQIPFKPVLPQIFQNPGAIGVVQAGNHGATPTPFRPAASQAFDPGAVAPAVTTPVITPPRTGDAGLTHAETPSGAAP